MFSRAWVALSVAVACGCGSSGPQRGTLDAATDGTDLGTDASAFVCGSLTCGSGTYCVEYRELDGAVPDQGASCQQVPQACGNQPTCQCMVPGLTGPPCNCTDDGAGHVMVVCLPGG